MFVAVDRWAIVVLIHLHLLGFWTALWNEVGLLFDALKSHN